MIKKHLKKRVYPKERQEIIDELRLKQYDNGTWKKSQKNQKNHNKVIQRQLQMAKERYISRKQTKKY